MSQRETMGFDPEPELYEPTYMIAYTWIHACESVHAYVAPPLWRSGSEVGGLHLACDGGFGVAAEAVSEHCPSIGVHKDIRRELLAHLLFVDVCKEQGSRKV